ncbi:MAG TPA: transglycosylase SLT domain-containing protein [Candidatus Acidoferrum sp.]|nr:transglycosylase SLT domain-containing protein [Candidatus Acidoferrum sp.]
MRFFSRPVATLVVLLVVCSVCLAATGSKTTAPAAKPALTESQLEKLARSLKGPRSSQAYAQLSVFASQKSTGVLGMRAALALGYFDYAKQNYAQALKWLARAKSDPLLADYALYWTGAADFARGHGADAVTELREFLAGYSDSVVADQALQTLGEAAIASDRPAAAVAALDASPLTPQRPALILLRAEAHEHLGQMIEAVADYESVYTRFATSDQAREAGVKLGYLRGSLGEKFPALSLEQRLSHAAMIFGAKEWRDAREEYTVLLPELLGADRERAQLRILECGMALGAGPSEVAGLAIIDPDADGERFTSLADFYRSQNQDAQMTAAVESAISRAPQSHWAESALFLAGNYYWVQLDRDRAASYYKRVEETYPAAPDAASAQWRVAWTAVLKRQPDCADLLKEHLRRFPGSPYTSDALYWLGRLAEESEQSSLARSYYTKLSERYPQNYFESLASARLSALGPGPVQVSDVIAQIPPVSAIPKLDGVIPLAAVGHQARADALRSIAFDASAELELRAGYAATGEPRLLLEAAEAAATSGHYGAAIVTVRQIFPQLESQPFSEVPRDVWTTAYALPFEAPIQKWSSHAGLDPMLVAGLIHQESAFDPEARSGKNAIGLMQLLPKTARLLAKQQRIRYSRAELTDPDYNVRLGTAYFAQLEKQFGSVEAALAAYNAGEDRVMAWTAGQTYRDTAEFVDSIPFTETRQYVQIIARNTEIYRRLYGSENNSRGTRVSGGH